MLRDNEHIVVGTGAHAYHAHNFVVGTAQSHTFDAGSRTAHCANGRLIEPYCAAIAVGKYHLAVALGKDGAYQLVVFSQVDGDHTIGARTGILGETRFLDQSILGGKHNVVALVVLRILELGGAYESIYAVLGAKVEQVLYCPALGVLAAFRNLKHPQPVATAQACEKEHVVVIGSLIHILDEVLVTCVAALGAHAATVLSAVFSEGRALDVTEV